MTSPSRSARRLASGLRSRAVDLVDRWRGEQPLEERTAEARDYWADTSDEEWSANSHWREGLGDEAWFEVGREHLRLHDLAANALGHSLTPDVVVEWGCGGGANAVAFAPRTRRFVAADVSEASLAECERQVAAECAAPVEQRLIDIARPEAAAAGLQGACELFLCLYVLELTAGREEALRIMRIAADLLSPTGMALVQVKYHTADRRTRGRGRDYRRHLASMTTFGIDEFWTLVREECGLEPRLVVLVPENRLDRRYAYYALTLPDDGAAQAR